MSEAKRALAVDVIAGLRNQQFSPTLVAELLEYALQHISTLEKRLEHEWGNGYDEGYSVAKGEK